MGMLFFVARRFVAGERLAGAIESVRALNDRGLLATLDFLGEDVRSRDEALRTRDMYFAMIDAIGAARVRANLSVKLSALGLLIAPQLAIDNLRAIVERNGSAADPFVRIDMERSTLVDATLNVFEETYRSHGNVGPVLQAYLKRTPADVERVVGLGARIRLCKGAYHEPASIAIRDIDALRAQYLTIAGVMLRGARYPAFATHDKRLIRELRRMADEHHVTAQSFEFQMLYGVRPKLQRELVRAGYGVRVYVPFGTHWASYFYRRVTERRENALFALRSLLPW